MITMKSAMVVLANLVGKFNVSIGEGHYSSSSSTDMTSIFPRKRVCQRASYCGISPGEPPLAHKSDLVAVQNLGINLAELMIKKGALRIMTEARKQGASTSAS